ncbi:MAG: 4-(cytidine 5'-diphospho)-2-C-methyl-D-erythritol kinase [Acidobacteria bacterium]|nr:4-(cytidine 5'-diphospho)-2-C-methyl-D-erythritol kinase [Acidobacteriota bacterium]
MPAEVSLWCPAKVNLSLRVHCRRPDGFHEVSTVLQTIDVCDRLEIQRVDRESRLRIEVAGGGAPADDSNLVLKAARAFFATLGEPARGVRFRLEKRIPAGSGLGGGSSDAAAALLGLQSLWGRPLDALQLQAVGTAVGSDVPFFLVGGTAFATGRGEQVTMLDDIPPAPMLVVVPAVEVSTADVYGAWKAEMRVGSGEGGEEPAMLPPPSRRGDAAAWVLGNDLEPVVRELHPEVNGLLLALRSAGGAGSGGPQVSGSGGAVFAFSESPGTQSALAGMDVHVFRTRTLPREVAGSSCSRHFL